MHKVLSPRVHNDIYANNGFSFHGYLSLFFVEEFPGIKTKIITADFNDDECYKRIEDQLANLEIGVLGVSSFVINAFQVKFIFTISLNCCFFSFNVYFC